MSYQVLARKWRPKIFREMAGQEHVLKALINALDHDRLHHAYLFTGTRGVGKTTIARILAKCLNCEQGVSSEPCGTCNACVAVNEGRFVDLIEMDAASRSKVDEMREMLDNVQYTPTAGRYKVYLIDEVHMLSGHSFNALLKTLEEPPPHVKFLLATTDPQKIPATILSRCLQFSLKNMSPERVVKHLTHVLEQEMVQFEEPALWLLGRAAAGSMRDALSLTDQAIAFGSGKLLEHDVQQMLGTIDHSAVYQLLDALIAGDGEAVLAEIQRLSEHAVDFAGVLEALQDVLHRLSLAQVVPAAVDNSQGDRQRLLALAAQISPEDLQLYYQVALNSRRDLPYAPDARAGLEMALLRMLAFKPLQAGQVLVAEEAADQVKKPPSQPAPETGNSAVDALDSGSAGAVQETAEPSENGSSNSHGGSAMPKVEPGVSEAVAAADSGSESSPNSRPISSPSNSRAAAAIAALETTDSVPSKPSSAEGSPERDGPERENPGREGAAPQSGTADVNERDESDERDESGFASAGESAGAMNEYEAMMASAGELPPSDSPQDSSSVQTGSPSVDQSAERAPSAAADALAALNAQTEALSQLAQNHRGAGDSFADTGGVNGAASQEATAEIAAPVQERMAFAALNSISWRERFREFALPGILGNIASQCHLLAVDGQCLRLQLAPANATLLNERYVERLSETLGEYFEQAISVDICVGDVEGETPLQYLQRRREEQLASLTSALYADPAAQLLQQTFSAQLDKQSIKPSEPV